jgi:hypothetical protein
VVEDECGDLGNAFLMNNPATMKVFSKQKRTGMVVPSNPCDPELANGIQS